MIPFMGAQSAVLGYQFGVNYEMGKRTVKSLPNEMFNEIRQGSDKEINVVYGGKEYTMTYGEYLPFLARMQYEQMITEFRISIPDYQSLQNDIIQESVKIEVKKAERTPSAMAEIISALGLSTNDEVTTWLDSLSETERAFLIQNVPLLGLLYTFNKVQIPLPNDTTEKKTVTLSYNPEVPVETSPGTWWPQSSSESVSFTLYDNVQDLTAERDRLIQEGQDLANANPTWQDHKNTQEGVQLWCTIQNFHIAGGVINSYLIATYGA
jgi:hypothetical protein